MNIFMSHPRTGTRMAHEDALYLIGHFRSRATLEQTLHQARIKPCDSGFQGRNSSAISLKL